MGRSKGRVAIITGAGHSHLEGLGTVEDIGAAALYLLSEAGSWVTGQVLHVDGGTVDSNWPFAMPSGLSGPKGD